MWKLPSIELPSTNLGRLLASQLFILVGLLALDFSESPILPVTLAQSTGGCDLCGGIVRPGCTGTGEGGYPGDMRYECCGVNWYIPCSSANPNNQACCAGVVIDTTFTCCVNGAAMANQ